jgi:hypothetical protein
VGNAQRLYMGFKSMFQHPYVAEVRLSPPPAGSDGSLRWFEVDWTGELEWLLNCFACQVVHGDRASVPPG